MLRKTNVLFLVFHGLVLSLTGIALLLAKSNNFFEQILLNVTGENGVVTIAVFFVFLMTSCFAIVIIFNHQFEQVFTNTRRHFVSLIAIAFYLFAMQEIKWSQLLHRQASNSGNDADLEIAAGSNTLINTDALLNLIHLGIFIGFIVIPLVIYFLPEKYKQGTTVRGKIVIYLPSIHNMLMFAFGCLFFCLLNPLNKLNFYVLGLFAIALLMLLITKKYLLTTSHLIHLSLFALAIAVLPSISDTLFFNAPNHQLWKFIAGYAFFYWLYNWTMTLKNKSILPE